MLDLNEKLRTALASRIRAVIADLPYSKADTAERLGVTPQAITGWEKRGRIGKTALTKLAALTGHSVAYFLTGKESDDSDWSQVRGFSGGEIALGDGASVEQYAEAHKLMFRTTSLRKQGLLGKPLEVYYGRGDSMEPSLHNGDAMLVDRSDVTPRDGAIFLLESEDGAIAKRLIEIDGRWYISSDNPHDPKWRKPVPLENGRRHFQILGRVRWIARWEG